MGNYGDPFDNAVPPIGTEGTAYASTINAILTEAMVRLSSQVPLTSVAPANADLDLNSNYSIRNALYVQLVTSNAVPTGAPFGRLQRYNGNLYWVDSSGAVQITSGGGLNAAGIGGLGGDYGQPSNNARLNYNATDDVYYFYDDPAVPDWSGIRCDYAEIMGSGAFKTKVDSRATVDWTFSLPATGSASGRRLLSIDNLGEVEHSATITSSPTFSADVILSGAAKVQHSTRILLFASRMLGLPEAPATANQLRTGVQASSATCRYYVPLDGLIVGSRIQQVSVECQRPAAGTARVQLYYVDANDGFSNNPQAIGTEGTNTGTGAGVLVIQAGINHTVLTGRNYLVRVTLPNSSDEGQSILVSYDQPA